MTWNLILRHDFFFHNVTFSVKKYFKDYLTSVFFSFTLIDLLLKTVQDICFIRSVFLLIFIITQRLGGR
jgi:hypothetical protein